MYIFKNKTTLLNRVALRIFKEIFYKHDTLAYFIVRKRNG